MNLTTKKKYLKIYISQGIPIAKALNLIFASEDEKKTIAQDGKFLSELEEIFSAVAMRRLTDYNARIDEADYKCVSPQDHLKRLAYTLPEVYDREAGAGVPVAPLPVIIDCGGGVVREIPQDQIPAVITEETTKIKSKKRVFDKK